MHISVCRRGSSRSLCLFGCYLANLRCSGLLWCFGSKVQTAEAKFVLNVWLYRPPWPGRKACWCAWIQRFSEQLQISLQSLFLCMTSTVLTICVTVYVHIHNIHYVPLIMLPFKIRVIEVSTGWAEFSWLQGFLWLKDEIIEDFILVPSTNILSSNRTQHAATHDKQDNWWKNLN